VADTVGCCADAAATSAQDLGARLAETAEQLMQQIETVGSQIDAMGRGAEQEAERLGGLVEAAQAEQSGADTRLTSRVSELEEVVKEQSGARQLVEALEQVGPAACPSWPVGTYAAPPLPRCTARPVRVAGLMACPVCAVCPVPPCLCGRRCGRRWPSRPTPRVPLWARSPPR
jgi:hypothetical protein